jgi:hypothetical protein
MCARRRDAEVPSGGDWDRMTAGSRCANGENRCCINVLILIIFGMLKSPHHSNIMAPGRASKRPLDTPARPGQPSAVRPAITLVLLLWARPGTAQAPPSASLWRVAAASLTTPPALASGATGAFWNPAVASPAGLQAGLQIVRTSDVLGLNGILAGVTKSLGRHAHAGVLLGRMDVQDLIRTTSSPTSAMGSIPVYDQMFAARASVVLASLQVGALVRVHDARFDVIRESGVTVDLGLRYAPTRRLLVAAATHFLPVDLSERENTDYYAGAQYAFAQGTAVAGIKTSVVGRYGLSYRASGDIEHAVAVGTMLADFLGIDASIVRETAFGDSAWRPGFGVEIRIGRYVVTFARTEGVNDLSGTYRVGLDVDFIR